MSPQYPDELEKVAIADFIEYLPGYKAQNITFGFMIGFLVVISAIVIGIFIFVLTTQKSPIFGLMKIQGLSKWLYLRFCTGSNLPSGWFGNCRWIGWNVFIVPCLAKRCAI